MNIRRLITLVFITVMVLGITGPAAANDPQPVDWEWCNFWWWSNADQTWYVVEGDGQLVQNTKGNIFNLSCKAVIDFDGSVSWDDFCAWIPGSCKGDTMAKNRLDFYHDVYEGGEYSYSLIGFGTLNVNRQGEARWKALFSPWSCDSGYVTNNITLELPEGFWSEGGHSYEIHAYFLDGYEEEWVVNFEVSPEAPLYRGQVRLGLFEPSNFWMPVNPINPAQDTFIQGTYYGPEYSKDYFFDYGDITIDNGDPITIDASPFKNRCSDQHWSWYLRTWGPKF